MLKHEESARLGQRGSGKGWLLFPRSPNFRKNQMQLASLKPNLSRFYLKFRHCASGHTQEVLCLARLFPAGADALKKVLLRYSIIGFNIICANTCRRAYQLAYDSACDRVLGNGLCEIDNRLTKSSSSVFQIIKSTSAWFFPDRD